MKMMNKKTFEIIAVTIAAVGLFNFSLGEFLNGWNNPK